MLSLNLMSTTYTVQAHNRSRKINDDSIVIYYYNNKNHNKWLKAQQSVLS